MGKMKQHFIDQLETQEFVQEWYPEQEALDMEDEIVLLQEYETGPSEDRILLKKGQLLKVSGFKMDRNFLHFEDENENDYLLYMPKVSYQKIPKGGDLKTKQLLYARTN